MAILPFPYSHDGAQLRGYVSLPENLNRKVPGVLVVPDFMGPDTSRVQLRAEGIAALGYASLVVDMYGLGRVPASREEAGTFMAPFRSDRNFLRARVLAAYSALRAHPSVDPDRIAIMGYCFGGGCSLELARTGAALRGAVSIHGNLDTPLPAEANKVSAKILVLHGDLDPLTTAVQMSDFMNEMRAAHIDWQVVYYSGAKHGFTNPEADAIGSPAVAYNALADRRSQTAVRDFLAEVFA